MAVLAKTVILIVHSLIVEVLAHARGVGNLVLENLQRIMVVVCDYLGGVSTLAGSLINLTVKIILGWKSVDHSC